MSDLTPEDLTVQEMERFLDFCGERIFARSQGVASDAQRFLAAIRAGKIPGLVWHRPGSLASSREMDADALRARVAELEATATYAGKGTAKDWAEMCGAAENKVEELEHGLAELEAQAKRCWRACGRRGASGERRMYKQQPAIDCDAAITAFLEGK